MSCGILWKIFIRHCVFCDSLQGSIFGNIQHTIFSATAIVKSVANSKKTKPFFINIKILNNRPKISNLLNNF